MSCMNKGADIIMDSAVTAGNFKIAFVALVMLYEIERLLISKHFERHFDIPAMTKEYPIKLASLHDGTYQVLRTGLKRHDILMPTYKMMSF